MHPFTSMPLPSSMSGIPSWSFLTSPSYIFVLSNLNLAFATKETELRMKSTTARINKHGNGSLMDWFRVRVLLTFVRHIKFQVKACNLSLQDNHSFSKSEEIWVQVALSSCNMDVVQKVYSRRVQGPILSYAAPFLDKFSIVKLDRHAQKGSNTRSC